ncbi:MAG TPA: nucleotide exchange factor GrpE [Chitinophagaceae bacterium]|nr:nucleotide exchange factor GrpE [Chitinophagaceae bacterium]
MAILLTIVPLPASMYYLVQAAINFEKMAEKDMKQKENNAQDDPAGMNINTDENLSGTTHLNEPVEEESELERLRTELEEMNDKYLRKIAEFDNFRRRSAKERMELIQTAGKDVITDMLDVLDDCDRAQKQLENSTDDVMKEGVMLVFNKLRNTLMSRGVKAMETLHQEFNPDLHEAITEIPALTDELKGKVVDEVVKGYYLNDKIIRHAKVVVGK